MKHKHLVSLTVLCLIFVLAACAQDGPAPTSAPLSQDMPATLAPTVPPSATTGTAETLPTDTPPATQAPAMPASLPTLSPASTPEPATSTATPTEQIPTSTAMAQFVDPTTLSLELEQIATGLDTPVFATHAGDGSGRLFVVEKPGRIVILGPDGQSQGVFLDILDLSLIHI